MSARSPWERHTRQWSRVGPPLRPSAEDVAVAGAALDVWGRATGRSDPTMLLTVDGEVVLYDVNRTPGAAADPRVHAETIDALSAGLRDFLS